MVLVVMLMKIWVFLDVTPYRLVSTYRRFGGVFVSVTVQKPKIGLIDSLD
jgi:hypothetical protein